jgi:hypothetical protein
MATTTGHIFTIEQYGSFKISPETTEPFKSRKDRKYLYKALLCIDQIGWLHFLVILVSAYMYMWGGYGV